jgi:3-deoxy-manno-octulosonate cytidylyltransferase (CMP-KDO synthetase)
MKTIGVIPARLGSTRLKAKVLMPIAGKPMIQHVWERSKKSKKLDGLLIACDDDEIIKTANSFGAKAVLTRKDHPSGTDRIAEAVAKLDVDVVINIQGDEPLIHPSIIDDLIDVFDKNKDCVMATVIKPIRAKEELDNPNIVKVVVDNQKDAIYFSRAVIPYNRDQKSLGELKYYKHLGIYGYRKSFLMMFKDLKKSYLEQVEQLEQLRALEAGYKIKTVVTEHETISVDTKEDLARVEAALK